ncbi:MAG: hypothetical protein Kow0042_26700 [Calditrichia bacterium]
MDQNYLMPRELDLSFPFNYHIQLENTLLSQSIKKHGILQPIWIVHRAPNHLIIDGHRRVQAALNLNFAEIPVQILPEEKFESLYTKALSINISTQPLSLIEKLRAFQIATQNFSENTQQEVRQILNLTHHRDLNHILDDLNNIPPRLLKYLHELNVQMRMLTRLLRFSYTKYERWFDLFVNLRFKGNEMVTILEAIEDIFLRDCLEPDQCYQQLQIADILQSPRTPQQKIQEIKRKLNDHRYPLLREIQKKIKEKSDVIEKEFKGKLRIEWDNTLEKPGIVVNIHLPDADAFSEIWQKLKNEEIRLQLESLLNHMNKLPEEEP